MRVCMEDCIIFKQRVDELMNVTKGLNKELNEMTDKLMELKNKLVEVQMKEQIFSKPLQMAVHKKETKSKVRCNNSL